MVFAMRREDTTGSGHARRAPAGGSALSYYEEQRKGWIRRNRRVFRVLDLMVGFIVVASLALWRIWPPSAWYGGLIAGMALCFDLAARLNPPTWIENWQYGGFGEQRTGRELSNLGAEWLVLHDLRRSDGTNIDHFLVGPPGVFLLDTKNIGTEVQVDGDELIALRPDGRPRYRDRRAASQARGAAAALSQALTAARSGCWVHAVLVVWGDMRTKHVPARKLDWVAGSSVLEWLGSLPADRDQHRLERVRDVLVAGSLEL